MPDQQVLYVVTAIVVVGLVAWVAAVLTRRSKDGPPGQNEVPLAPVAAVEVAPALPLAPVQVLRKPKGSEPPPTFEEEVAVDLEEEEDELTGPQALILVTAVGRTDPGLKRKHNEDSYLILADHHLFVIADGMGRHAAGEIASQLCVVAIDEMFKSGAFPPRTDANVAHRAARIRAAILSANDRILKSSQETEAYAGMGTTVVSAYFSPNNQRVYIAHVGDSRCYRIRDGKISQLTVDHTLGAAGITGKSAAILSRAVGVEENVEVDVLTESPLPGDVYLLCSDGLSRMVSNEEIEAAVTERKADLDDATKALIDLANERGGRDNITTILVRVDTINPFFGM
jgi:protein phosphatase